MTNHFKMGVNYWPRKKAMYWWSNFDRGEVKEEFSLIEELGLDLVRIFLLWDDFQPNHERVSTPRLRELEQVLELADECNLGANLTFFTGHMSGPNWVPRWLLDHDSPAGTRPVICSGHAVNIGYRNPFDDPMALKAEEKLIFEVVNAFRTHPAVDTWNLGNEPDIFAMPPSAHSGKEWCRRFIDQIKSMGAPQPVTVGIHMGCLERETGFRVHEAFEHADHAVVHGYPMYTPWAQSPVDPDFVPFLTALTHALSQKPTMVEEFGGPTAPPGDPSGPIRFSEFGTMREQYLVSEEEMAEHLAKTLPKLQQAGAIGAMLWCFADYSDSLYSHPPCNQSVHERFFGLIRGDGTLKPHAEVIRQFAESQPIVLQTPTNTVELGITPQEYYEAPSQHCQALYKSYLNNVDTSLHR